MNLRRRYWALATSAIFTVAGLSSCKDYSPDEPLPDVYTRTLFVASNNQIVYAIDPINPNDKWKWKFPVDGEVQATPLLYNKNVYIATLAGNLYRVDAQYGKLQTNRSFGAGEPIAGTPIVRDGILYVTAGSKIYALDPGSLSDIPTITPYDIGGTIVASPTTHNIPGQEPKAIFVAGMNNKIVALKPDLSLIWERTPDEAGAFYSSPCVANDSFIYIGNDNGFVYSFKIQDGTDKWKFPTGGQVRSSPIQIGGNVLVGSNDRYLYSVDSATGLTRWKVLTGDGVQSSPSVFNQYVYFGSFDGNMYCVDIIDGNVKWQMKTFGLIKSSPTIYNGDVYFGSFDKNLYRLDAMDGSQKFVFNINGQMATSPIIDTLGGAAVPSISGDYRW
ncbi:outer membrane protein assembly factor BamB family protein [Taibaiella helva]|uniref:outer membrane protein assembly factor BamB family protein n=1 Tax=Taibaiella helva TaxID=2301235 RepID=UPI000E57EFA4|nr:PQQ-binding-like beta-propeller repeat protein [Taibaiella helva]